MIRLIVHEPMSGSRNMAIDQALLESAAQDGTSTLRVYRWQPATVSLGYFQTWASRADHAASLVCPLVRRASGGGAIIHDRELTYSLALPSDDRWARENRDLFDTVHRTLIESLGEFGVSNCHVVNAADARAHAAGSDSKPFLCFQRRSPGDVVINGKKVIGSAQRRLENALLQHGSVLVQQSEYAPELPGICELNSGTSVSVESMMEAWPECLARQMKWTLTTGELNVWELERAESIELAKFASSSWNRKR